MVGKKIPEWDLKHRLYTNRVIGPICKDFATIFRINSTFMDVSDQPYMVRHRLAVMLIVLLLMMFFIGIFFFMVNRGQSYDYIFFENIFMNLILTASFFGVLIPLLKFFLLEYFSLLSKPIRFNRVSKKLYAIRKRVFFFGKNGADLVWICDWCEETFFCIHKERTAWGPGYDIRAYKVNLEGVVVQEIAFGRSWTGRSSMKDLVAQWNYWCVYMNEGPAALPLPQLFFSKKENFKESFLFCLYDFDIRAKTATWIIFMPIILFETAVRILAIATCREPLWPEHICAASVVSENDEFDQPSGKTPVGWAETLLAIERNEYPADPRCDIIDWAGERDQKLNGDLWAADIPPEGLTISSLATSISVENLCYPYGLRKNKESTGEQAAD